MIQKLARTLIFIRFYPPFVFNTNFTLFFITVQQKFFAYLKNLWNYKIRVLKRNFTYKNRGFSEKM
ncbi:hypothetical protein TTE1553 [Caldanaerobacter subterraneus subsp. tengcongensis MB4]|uniref:Uncharacterized protein n=1 Tax=Caldanaerobacter subterraneus subsp. tengcongensis (strain DSM 15242 / JCM 11007 / NBRC 100824 / MB4) TaxID=273068 RepID=Q8R9Q2_CALS4|nr:hypothetical protein TTE1553 [Caldanaerobacter subterraneus subsp. tengcongensis MB4]